MCSHSWRNFVRNAGGCSRASRFYQSAGVCTAIPIDGFSLASWGASWMPRTSPHKRIQIART